MGIAGDEWHSMKSQVYTQTKLRRRNSAANAITAKSFTANETTVRKITVRRRGMAASALLRRDLVAEDKDYKKDHKKESHFEKFELPVPWRTCWRSPQSELSGLFQQKYLSQVLARAKS